MIFIHITQKTMWLSVLKKLLTFLLLNLLISKYFYLQAVRGIRLLTNRYKILDFIFKIEEIILDMLTSLSNETERLTNSTFDNLVAKKSFHTEQHLQPLRVSLDHTRVRYSRVTPKRWKKQVHERYKELDDRSNGGFRVQRQWGINNTVLWILPGACESRCFLKLDENV